MGVMPNPGFREQLQLFQRLGFTAPTKGDFSIAGNWQRLHCLKGGIGPVRTFSVEAGASSSVISTIDVGAVGDGEVLSSTANADGLRDPSVYIQFCSDMHLELPLETKRVGEHL